MLNTKVGVLGGGQLGRMMAAAAHRLGVSMTVLDPLGPQSPAGLVAPEALTGKFDDAEKVLELASMVDVITAEIEHINTQGLEQVELTMHNKSVQPSAKTIRIIQDKYAQKVHLQAHNIPLPEFYDVPSVEALDALLPNLGLPCMLKSRFSAYDGKGNCAIYNESEIEAAFAKLGGKQLYVEKWCPFQAELAVMVARSTTGEMAVYPVVQTVQKDNICHVVLAPAQIDQAVAQQAQKIALEAIASMPGAGIYGVEMFLTGNKDIPILLNEIAPRPHNSGHYTIEACHTDQFEQHLRAVMGLPLGEASLKVGTSLMINVLGTGDVDETLSGIKASFGTPGACVHWYGKNECKKGRKMGHITVTADNLHQLAERVLRIEPHAFDNLLLPPLFSLPAASSVASNSSSSNKPIVGIIMGSDSDLPCMKEAAIILDEFNIPYELTIVSAHRTPTRMYEYATQAASRGIKIIIAGAGGAAHLPGMVAAITSLPVIGVPVKSSALSGQDSLLSIVQMPRGIPVATVAIDNATNAGLLAVRMVGAFDAAILSKMTKYMEDQRVQVEEKAAILESKGYAEYLATAKKH